MAKFFISNIRSHIDDNVNLSKAYFPKYEYFEVGNGYGVVYHKEFNTFGNLFMDKESGDFCCGTGSFIYKESVGEIALSRILADFEEELIPDIKKNMLGNYAICISKAGKSFIFNDYYGLYDVCYYFNDSNYIIANQLSEAVIASGSNVFDEYSLLMEIFQIGSFPGNTLYKDIKKLKGDEYIELKNNCSIKTIKKNDYVLHYDFVSEEKAVNDISTWAIKVAGTINKCYGSEVVFLTGGLDSRLTFAAFLASKSNFRCSYGRGLYTSEEDLVLAKKMCGDYNKELNILNWYHAEESESIDWIYQKGVFEKIGFSNIIALGDKNQYDSLKNDAERNGKFFGFGYFSEAIRLREWAESLKSDYFSLDNYIDDYYLNPLVNKEVYGRYDDYRDYIKNGFINQLMELGVGSDYDRIPIDMFERFRWKQSRLCDSRMEFFINNYTYSFSLLSAPMIHEAILSLPADVIKYGCFQIKVIKAINSELIKNYDVFSHCRLFRINKHDRKVRKITIKNLADITFKIVPFMKTLLYTIWKNIRYHQNVTNDNIEKQIATILKDVKIPFNISAYKGEKYGIRQTLIGLREVEVRIKLNKHRG